MDLPLGADGGDHVEVVGGDDGQHPLLALARHHLRRRHARLAAGNRRDVDVETPAATSSDFAGGSGQAGGAQVLEPLDHAGVEHLEARLDEAFLAVGITDLHRRALRLLALLERGRRQHGRSTDAVAPGGRPEEDGERAIGPGQRMDDAIGGEQADATDVDQGVARVGAVDTELAAHGGHADGVAVPGDTGHDTVEEEAVVGVVQRAETQGVEERDGAGAHREDVAEDASHSGGRALVGLHR